MPVNRIYERTIVRDDEFIVWYRETSTRKVYWITRGRPSYERMVKPTSLRRCEEWLFAHRIHGHTPIAE
jgi:uncharacterized protein YaeQ